MLTVKAGYKSRASPIFLNLNTSSKQPFLTNEWPDPLCETSVEQAADLLPGQITSKLVLLWTIWDKRPMPS